MSVAFLSPKFTRELPRTIHRLQGERSTIEVRENSRYRWLVFGNGVVQSAMDLGDPARLALPYTRSMLAPLIFDPAPREVLALGVGGGGLVRYLRAFLPEVRLTAVDADPEVLQVAREFFSLPPAGDGLALEVRDGREALSVQREADLILVDIFDEQGMPDWICAEETLRAARAALSERGMVSINLMPNVDIRLAELLRPIREVFLGHVLCTTLVDYRNVIVLAFRQAPANREVRDIGRRANQLEKRYRLPLGRIFRNICGVNICHRGRLIV